MTNDEKAKAYDEALEDMRVIYPNLKGDAKLSVEHAFPQLRESEDDRTRNEIIAFIEATIHRGGGTPIPKEKEDKWLAYLEKQKEKKPIGGIYWHAIKKGEKLPCRAYIWNPDYEKYHDCWEGRLIPNLEKIHVGADTWYLPAKDVRDLPREGVDELPKEQKPAEKQDYSGLTDLELAILRGFLAAGIENVPVTIIKETAKECLTQMKPAECIEDSVKFEEGFKAGRESGLRDGQKYVLNNLDSYGLCKPAEWSEEDERMLSRCIKSIECSKMFAEAKTFKDAKDNEINWLKNRFKFLKSQPKQEWSEEDENALKYIHELISWGYAEKFMDAQTAHDMRKWVNEHISHDTFQNGNSRWKPSEEHLSALLAVVNDPNNIGSQTCQLALTDLYEQLKKL